ncbi:hypothetical protein ACTJJ0_02625 [Chitinophaga sp. 22321]|uniref:Uncharacterized protein n=1 Tax=Chitinophaga hostae TaxID=2831022 RepID=A0ABS5IUB0_9BACT|nr:hypothetical protein [Chitinophaga hostae]MBS0026553.1 hypothetical protein [Chitinophaga hostae]
MKSLILLFFFLVAGFTYANAQARFEQTGGGTGKVRDALFPSLKKDIADMQSRSVQTKPDPSVISTPTKKRLFTDYQPSHSTLKAAAASKKTTPIPSDVSAKEASNNLKQDKALQPTPTSVPNQDGSGAPAPHKKN